MRIIEVYLEGYRRLKLNKVNSIKITASELIQLIIGTNGSGKSSLQEQVNCWVADRKDFKVGGKKIVKVEHNNTIYETRQYFHKKNSTFEFIVDGANINEGETGAVQKELLKIHFGLDSEVMDIMLGKVRFTKMNPTQRREFLTKISGLDLTYAIGLFKRVASASRDVAGAKKLLDKRMVNETANVWKDEDWEQWRGIQDRLSSTLTQLMGFTNSSARNFNEVDRQFQEQAGRMHNLVDKHLDEYMGFKPLVIAEESIFSLSDYQHRLSELNGNKSGLVTNRDTIMGELDELQRELEDLRKFESIDAVKWARIKEESEKKLEKLKAKEERFSWMNFDSEYIPLLTEVRGMLSEFIDCKTAIDFKGEIERGEYEKLKHELHERRTVFVRAENTLDKLRHRVQDIKEAKREECPKCSYIYIPGVSEKESAELEAKIENGVAFIEKETKALEKIEEAVIGFERCESNMREFRNIINGFMMFRGVWKEVISDEVLYNDPMNVLHYLVDAELELLNMQDINQLQDTILDAERKLIKAGESSNVSSRLESIAKRESSLTDKLNGSLKALEELEKTRTFLQSNFKRADFVSRAEVVIGNMLSDYERLLEERVEAMRELRLQEDIAIHQQKLATVTKTIQEQETQRGILNDLEEQSLKLEKDGEMWKLLTSALSPTTGLIAEQLLGFMHKFTESINGIIDKVWTHDLEVLPCKGSGENLDYKFPLRVEGEPEANADVALSSTGQADIIDFAFILVSMSYLGMDDYPLYTDELGSSFDEEHRENLQRFLKLLIDSSNCSQLWTISHAYAVQNSLGACETCVVDKSNITVPSRYNEHVEFG